MRTGALALPTTVRLRDLAELTKAGIAAMVVVSAAAGMLLASADPLPWWLWIHGLVGTGLVAAGAGTLNQVVERDVDAQMRRTAQRPLPAGRLHPDAALALGVGLALAGLGQLALGTTVLAALLAGLTLAGYVFVYTPLKQRSSLATIVGAVPGAMPPLIGWAAVAGDLGPGAWALFAVLFFWQMPHFLAIAWLYRVDYARAGFPLLTVGDDTGLRTGRQALLYGAALLPVSLLPAALGLAGGLYLGAAALAGAALFAGSVAFAMERGTQQARRLLFLSILYLPVVLGGLVVDRLS